MIRIKILPVNISMIKKYIIVINPMVCNSFLLIAKGFSLLVIRRVLIGVDLKAPVHNRKHLCCMQSNLYLFC